MQADGINFIRASFFRLCTTQQGLPLESVSLTHDDYKMEIAYNSPLKLAIKLHQHKVFEGIIVVTEYSHCSFSR